MKIVIVGAGGQARVVHEICSLNRNLEVVAFVDNKAPESEEFIRNVPVVGDHSVLPKLIKNGVRGVIIAIGDNTIRATYFEKFRGMGLEMVNAIHPSSFIANNVEIASGVTICIGSIIATEAIIGNNVIINTGATIDHENKVGDHASIGPRCAVAGRVIIKKGAYLGIGSTVKEYVTIGKNAIIGAGSVVLEDIPDNVVAVGIPAKVIKTNDKGNRR